MRDPIKHGELFAGAEPEILRDQYVTAIINALTNGGHDRWIRVVEVSGLAMGNGRRITLAVGSTVDTQGYLSISVELENAGD
jgi:hypothetical protein